MIREGTRRRLALAAALGAHLVAAVVVRTFRLPPSHVLPTSESIVEVSASDEFAAPPIAALRAASSASEGLPVGRAASGRLQKLAATGALASSRVTLGDTARPGSQAAADGLYGERSIGAASLSGWTLPTGAPDIHPRGVDFVARNGSHALADAPAPASISGGVIEALDAADIERGLGRGGPINTAVAAAAREDGPVRGSATFAVTIFSDGHVDVQVASAQTDWSRLIPAIRDAVRSASVRLPPSGRGLKVVVAVEASVRYPDGYAPPESTEVDGAAKVGPDRPTDSVAAGAPRVTLTARGKRCQAGVSVTVGGIGAGVDCSAAGVAARRVATRIVSENRL